MKTLIASDGFRRITYGVLLVGVLLLESCGGGGGPSVVSSNTGTPPPPAPDFGLTFDDPMLSLQQQGVSLGQQVGVSAIDGFSGTVSVSFSNLPAGISVSPAGPFSIAPGQTQFFNVAATSAAAVGSTVVTATGTSGSTKHTMSFTANVTAAAPFHLSASPPSLSLTPATTSNIVITLVNNSSGPSNIVVSLLQSLPNTGVNIPNQSNTVGPNQTQYQVQATLVAQSATNYPIVFTATDTISNQTSIVTVPLTITHALTANTTPTRSFFERTDMDVTGAVYDLQRKLVFATVNQLSEVLVLKSTDGSLLATVPFTEPRGIDESVDGTRVYVGGEGSSIGVIDPDSLQLIGQIPPPAPADSVTSHSYYNPVNVATLSNGKVLVLAAVTGSTETHVFLWDPASGSMTQRDLGTFPNPQEFTRSLDHSKVLLLGPFTSGPNGVIYDAASDMETGPFSYNGAPAISPDGSQIAAANGTGVTFFDVQGNVLGTVLQQNGSLPQIIYSRDGRFVYLFCDFFGAYSVATIDAHNFVPVGISPDVGVSEGDGTLPYDIDETGMVFGSGYRGIAYVDVTAPGALNLPIYTVSRWDGLTPDGVSTSSPTTASVNGVSFDPNAQYKVFVGGPPASSTTLMGTNVSVQSTSQTTSLNVTVPPAPPQIADMTVVRSDGWWEIAPLAASYGPHFWVVDGNSGPTAGGANITIYGFGLDNANTTVTIGGASAAVSKTIGPSSPTEFPFPVDLIRATTPPGVSGWADVTVTTPFGSTTLPRGYQYLASTNVVPLNGALNQIIYDRTRGRLYISNGTNNQVNVIAASSGQFITSIPVGMGPTGLALTPDSSRLAVVNSGDSTVSVIDPVQFKVLQTYNVLTPDDVNVGCGGVPLAITPAGPHGMFVAVDCVNTLLGGDLHFLDLNSGSLSCIGLPGCDSSGTSLGSLGNESLASSLDGNTIIVGSYEQAALVDLNAGTAIVAGRGSGTNFDVSIDNDNNVLSVNVGIYNEQFLLKAALQDLNFLDAGFNSANNIAGAKFSPSGSLFFVPQAPIGGVSLTRSVDVFDIHRQRLALRIALPEPLVAGLNTMCLDETGSKMFLISQSGITIAQLASVPLSIATINPSSAPEGAQITIRGSGFQTGAIVQFGSTTASTTVVDTNTIQAVVPQIAAGPTRITIINLDGSQYGFDAAFTTQ